MMALVLRLSGGALLLLGSLGTGWTLAVTGRKKLANMQEILYVLTRMSGEIGFGRFTLPQVCWQCGETGRDAFSKGLCRVTERMEENLGEDFSHIWQEEMGTVLKKDIVPESFQHCLLKLGQRMEVMDTQLCRELLQETCGELEQILQHYREQLENQNRVRVGLSMGVGMMILLLLW